MEKSCLPWCLILFLSASESSGGEKTIYLQWYWLGFVQFTERVRVFLIHYYLTDQGFGSRKGNMVKKRYLQSIFNKTHNYTVGLFFPRHQFTQTLTTKVVLTEKCEEPYKGKICSWRVSETMSLKFHYHTDVGRFLSCML